LLGSKFEMSTEAEILAQLRQRDSEKNSVLEQIQTLEV
jgi:hypothetical protein